MTNHYMFNLQDASCALMEQLILFHDYSMFFVVFILSLVGYAIFSLLLNKNLNLMLLFNEWVEILWTLLPGCILVFIALPSLKVLYLTDETSMSNLTLKVVGHQWYWSYEYSDFEGLEFDSYMKSEFMEDFRCLDVDNRVILPVRATTRLLITSSDVIHSWTIPALGIKLDANPGRLNQCSLSSSYLGLFYGQCSEICGALHSYMPICVEIVPTTSFLNWILAH